MIDYRYIEAFLAVVNTNSLSKAAESMYVSQSSISKWICQLEEEIGVELIVRHKGQRSIELTASGKELVPLAEEWMNLHGQIIGMKEHNRTSIRIVSVDSLNNTLMPPIYQELLRTDPELELSVLTGQSPDIYSMVERKQYDVGIVTVELHSPSLIVTPLLTEPFELLLYSEKEVDTSAPVTPDSLDVRKNLYIPSGYSLRQWHEYWFHTAKSYLWVDPQTPARMLFCEEELWTVVPLSVAAQLSRQPHVHRLQMTSSPSPRSTYYITHRYPRDNCKAVLPMVKDLLQRYASAYPLDV